MKDAPTNLCDCQTCVAQRYYAAEELEGREEVRERKAGTFVPSPVQNAPSTLHLQ